MNSSRRVNSKPLKGLGEWFGWSVGDGDGGPGPSVVFVITYQCVYFSGYQARVDCLNNLAFEQALKQNTDKEQLGEIQIHINITI